MQEQVEHVFLVFLRKILCPDLNFQRQFNISFCPLHPEAHQHYCFYLCQWHCAKSLLQVICDKLTAFCNYFPDSGITVYAWGHLCPSWLIFPWKLFGSVRVDQSLPNGWQSHISDFLGFHLLLKSLQVDWMPISCRLVLGADDSSWMIFDVCIAGPGLETVLVCDIVQAARNIYCLLYWKTGNWLNWNLAWHVQCVNSLLAAWVHYNWMCCVEGG